jgi:hypothetical protein
VRLGVARLREEGKRVRGHRHSAKYHARTPPSLHSAMSCPPARSRSPRLPAPARSAWALALFSLASCLSAHRGGSGLSRSRAMQTHVRPTYGMYGICHRERRWLPRPGLVASMACHPSSGRCTLERRIEVYDVVSPGIIRYERSRAAERALFHVIRCLSIRAGIRTRAQE